MVSRGGGALDQAVRVVVRSALLAAVTGMVGNALPLALYTVAQGRRVPDLIASAVQPAAPAPHRT